MNEMADEAAAQHTLAANPLVGVSGHDILDSARVLLGQIMRNPALVVQQSLGLLGELGRIATGESKLAPDTRDKPLPTRPGKKAQCGGRLRNAILPGAARLIAAWTPPTWVSATRSARASSLPSCSMPCRRQTRLQAIPQR